jgi:hypothetical protein
MQTYNDLMELARICLKQARQATDPALGKELLSMAREYQQRSAKRDGGEIIDMDQKSLELP